MKRKVKPKNALAFGARPELHWGSLQRSPDPLAAINNILFKIITEMLRKKQF